MANVGFVNEPLDQFEDVMGVFYGGRGQVAQQIVVTNRRLLIGPVNEKVAQEIDAYIVDQGLQGAGSVLRFVLTTYAPMNPETHWLRHVSSVEPTRGADIFHLPGLRIVTATDEVIDLGIVGTIKTPNFVGTIKTPNSSVEARDRSVAVIRDAVAAAKAASPPPT